LSGTGGKGGLIGIAWIVSAGVQSQHTAGILIAMDGNRASLPSIFIWASSDLMSEELVGKRSKDRDAYPHHQ
jgi:hypothetical protein